MKGSDSEALQSRPRLTFGRHTIAMDSYYLEYRHLLDILEYLYIIMVSIIRLQAIRASWLCAMVVPQTHVHVFVFSSGFICAADRAIYTQCACSSNTYPYPHACSKHILCKEQSVRLCIDRVVSVGIAISCLASSNMYG